MKREKIILCKKCRGKGYNIIPGELYDYHNGLYHESTKESCKECDSHGRIMKIKTVKYKKLDRVDTVNG